MFVYNAKVVEMGNVIEVVRYKNPIFVGYKSKKKDPFKKLNKKITFKDSLTSFNQSIKRTKRKIFELINCNHIQGSSKFLTLTFGENVTDYDQAMYSFKKFKQKIEYKINKKLEYVGAVEFQKRGAIHFHIVLFNCPYLKFNYLLDVWRKSTLVGGSVDIRLIDNVDNVGAYVTSYLGKDLANDKFFTEYKNKKRYVCSKNLKLPIVEKKDTLIKDHRDDLDNLEKILKGNKVLEYKSTFKKEADNYLKFADDNTGEVVTKKEKIIIYEQEVIYKQFLKFRNKSCKKNRLKL